MSLVDYLPNVGTEEAVGIAASTNIRSSTMKLLKLLIALHREKRTNIYNKPTCLFYVHSHQL